ncbi:MAG: 2Fe-2S iron-sulfur cluster-binding protein [Candidatus Dasytiphilus stammeri]
MSIKKNSTLIRVLYQGTIFNGNTQQILIEQLEEQQFIIPYFCRSGICGACKLRLIKGKIKTSPIIIDGFILSCCSIPMTNIELA